MSAPRAAARATVALAASFLLSLPAGPAWSQDEAEADVEQLIAEATKGDWNTRIKAVHALGRLGSVEGLSEGATDGDWQIRLTAVHWLGRQGDAGVPMLAHVTRTEPCRIIRLAAIHWLGSIGPAGIPALRETLGEDSPMIRVTSSYWLKKLEGGEDDGDGAPPAADDPALLRGASEEDLRGCHAVNLPPTKVVPLADGPSAYPAAGNPRDPVLAGEAPAEVDEWKPKPKRRKAKSSPERAKALDLLAEAPGRPRPAEAAAPAESPAAAPQPSTTSLKVEPPAGPPQPELAAAKPLPGKPDEKPLPETAAPPEADRERGTAPEPELGARPKGGPEPKLSTVPTWHLVKGEHNEAALTVREPEPGTPQHDPLPDLLKALHSSNWRHRYRAADLLGMMGAQAGSAVPDLIEATKDKKSAVRASAALALGNIGKAADPAVSALQKCLNDRHADVRYSAAVALGRMGTPAADRAFQRHVRSEAARMIENE